ncbi:O-unit flippase-like protein [Janibacter terrae]|uniref:O-unit flippase-like protein n=1 Tax=Janibacter terrae TaxID=103817 RepID=UPI0031F9F950
MSKIVVGAQDVRWSYANLLLTSGVNLALMPLILWALTPDEVGAWYLFTAIGGLALVLDMGLMTTLARHVTFVWCGAEELVATGYRPSSVGAPNYSLLSSILGAAKLVYHILGLTIFCLCIGFGTWHIDRVVGGSDAAGYIIACWLIYAVSIWWNVAFSFWNPLLRGIGEVAASGKANVAGKVTQLALTSAALVAGFGLAGVCASFLLSSLVFRALSKRFFYSRAGVGLRVENRASLKERAITLRIVWPNSLRQGLVSVSQFVLSSGPVFVASAFLALPTVAVVGLTVQVLGLIKVFGNTLFNVFQPYFGQARMTGDVRALKYRLSLSLGVATYSIAGVGAMALTLGDPLLKLVGSDVGLMPIAPGFAFLLSELVINQYALTTGFLATGNRIPMHWAYLGTAVAAIVGQVISIQWLGWGLWGLAIPTLAASLSFNAWFWLRRAAREVELTSLQLLKMGFSSPVAVVSRRLLN